MASTGIVVWMVGLPSSGKTTLARSTKKRLAKEGILSYNLDGDELRQGINSDLGFSENDRQENIRRAAHIAKILVESKMVVICSFITPSTHLRNVARSIIDKSLFHEIFIECSNKVCFERDVKGLYKKASLGQLKNLTGFDSPFDEPEQAELIVNTELFDLEYCTDLILNYIKNKMK